MTRRTRLGCEALEPREVPTTLAIDSPDLMDNPDLAGGPGAPGSRAHSDQIRVAPNPAGTAGAAARGIIIHF